jgi:Holliday junction DNA helicase RuvA
MFNYLKGTVKIIEAKHLTLEVNDIGYQIIAPNPYAYNVNEKVLVHTVYYVREDIAIIYGFKSSEQKLLFEDLISVKGIGPKSALAVLASGEVNDIVRAIETADAKYLNRFPGIGPKASQQIVLDLKGKLNYDGVKIKLSSRLEEVETALENLGYKSKEIQKLTEDLDTSLDTATLVKLALRKITK